MLQSKKKQTKIANFYTEVHSKRAITLCSTNVHVFRTTKCYLHVHSFLLIL